jgi:O-antigen ligase
VVDVVGAVLLVLFVGDSLLAAANAGSASPAVAVAVGSAASLVIGRVAGRRHRRVVAMIVFALVVGFVFVSLAAGTPGDLLGYQNASALLAVVGAVAAATLAVMPGPVPLRASGAVGAVGLASLPFLADAVASSFIVVLGIAVLVAVAFSGRVRWGIVAVGTVCFAILIGTVVLGATFRPDANGGMNTIAESMLSERRLALWHDALAIASEHPVLGVGPGRFPAVSPVAAEDADTRQAHNEFLQQAAETGLPGAILLVMLVVWGFARLLLVAQPDTATLLGSLALASLTIGASVDYVLHFPVIPVVGAALIGAAQTDPMSARDEPIGIKHKETS